MNIGLNRLGPKLILFALIFLALVAIVTGVLVTLGFRATERTATERSAAGLSNESRDRALAYTQQEAELGALQLGQAQALMIDASEYLLAMEQRGVILPSKEPAALAQTDGGVRYDPDPARQSDVWVRNSVTPNENLARDLQASAALDTLLPAMLRQYPDAVAAYYTGNQGWSRYYPPVGLHDLVPPDFPITDELFYVLASPAANPRREPVWTPPYVDPAGQGLLTTVSVPIYDGETLRGVAGMDISLDRIIARLGEVKITPSGSAFLIDTQGRLIAATEGALTQLGGPAVGSTAALTTTLGLDLTTTENAELRTLIGALRDGQTGIEPLQLADRNVFVAYAPLDTLGWGLATITPVDELTAEAAAVSLAIQAGTSDTVRQTMASLGVCFLLALVAIVVLSRNLTRPLITLAEAATQVAENRLDQPIVVDRDDEVGTLQQAFRTMVTNLAEQRAALEQQNRELGTSLESQRRLGDTVRQLSVPLLPLLDDVMILPLVGHIDAERAELLMQRLLETVHQQRTATVLIDITGVPVVDAPLVELLNRAMQAVRLLGAQVVLAGISAEAAPKLVAAEINLHGIPTYRDVRTAVATILRASTLVGR